MALTLVCRTHDPLVSGPVTVLMPVRFGTAFVFCIVFCIGSIQYSLARALPSSQYRIRNTNTEYETRANPCTPLDAPSTACPGSLERVSNLVIRILYSVFCIVHTFQTPASRIRIRRIPIRFGLCIDHVCHGRQSYCPRVRPSVTDR